MLPMRKTPRKPIYFTSSDGMTLVSDWDSIKCMGALKSMMKVLDLSKDQEDGLPIPLPSVHSRVLHKVLAYAAHYRAKEQPMRARGSDIPEWDKRFLNLPTELLFGIVAAANYLDMQQLMDVASQSVANMLSGRPAEELRGIFNLPDDLEPDQKPSPPNQNRKSPIESADFSPFSHNVEVHELLAHILPRVAPAEQRQTAPHSAHLLCSSQHSNQERNLYHEHRSNVGMQLGNWPGVPANPVVSTGQNGLEHVNIDWPNNLVPPADTPSIAYAC